MCGLRAIAVAGMESAVASGCALARMHSGAMPTTRHAKATLLLVPFPSLGAPLAAFAAAFAHGGLERVGAQRERHHDKHRLGVAVPVRLLGLFGWWRRAAGAGQHRHNARAGGRADVWRV